MASFVPPQVDHNLYTPILPQDNVQQIFSLLDQKQQFYNQGVKAAQNKISSMLNLENEVTSEPIKNMVTDFNKKANDIVKQYANLDFSLQGNVSLIDNIYDPLMDNELFLYDYAATKNYKTEYQKALGYRDSDKKEVRDLFNIKNLNHLNIAKQNLALAKSERDIKTYASQLKSAYYTPYYDVKGEIMSAFEKNKDRLTMSTDYENGQYILTVKDGNQMFPSLNAWINTFISDKAKNQLKIEKEVDFYSEMTNSGLSKEEYLSNTINEASASYKEVIDSNSKLLNNYKKELNSFPPPGKRYPKQEEKVALLNQKIANTEANLKSAQETFDEFNEYMQKASKGEIELSQFYDSAERLYVKDKVEQELTNMARSLSSFESRSLKKNEAYFSMLTENRLRDEFAWKQKVDIANAQAEADKLDLETQKYYADLAKEGLAYWDGKKWNIGVAGIAPGTTKMAPTTMADAQDTPRTIEEVNSKIDENLNTKSELANKAAIQLATALSSLQDTPLSVDEQNQLLTILKENPSTSSIGNLIKKYGRAIFEKSGLLSMEYGSEKGSLGDALSKLAGDAETYTTNTMMSQSGNKASYYKQLESSLDEYQASSTIVNLERMNISRDVKNSLTLFEKKYPIFKGALIIDPNTGKISLDPKFINIAGIGDASQTTWGMTLSNPLGFLSPTSTTSEETYKDPITAFNAFLKTTEGNLGRVGSYFKEVVASDANAFGYLKSNRAEFLSDPSKYRINSEDDYENSVYNLKYYGLSPSSTDSTVINAYNELFDKFFNSIPDQPYTMENKNVKRYASRIERQKGMEVIYPTEEYLYEVFGIKDNSGKLIDQKVYESTSNISLSTAKDIVRNLVKNGIRIKKDAPENTSSEIMQAYLNSGMPIPMNRSKAGVDLKFNLINNNLTGTPMIEGRSSDQNDFFLQPDLSYKIEGGALLPSSESSRFYSYETPIVQSAVNQGIFNPVRIVQDSQINFINLSKDPKFVGRLLEYINKKKLDPSKISGQVISDFINQD